MPESATHRRSIILFQFQTGFGCHLEETLVTKRDLVDSLVAPRCVQFCTFFCPSCNGVFLSVSWDNCVPTSGNILSGRVVVLLFVGLPLTHLYPSGSLARKIWNLVVPVHTAERLTLFASVHQSLLVSSETLSVSLSVCLITSTHLTGNRECCIIWVVKLQSRSFIKSVNDISALGQRIFARSSLFLPPVFDFIITFLLEVSVVRC